MADDRKHFIVKHDLRSLEALRNFIWRTEKDMPASMARVKEGDRWISFAFVNDEAQRSAVSIIAGFSECTNEVVRREIPLKSGDPALAGKQKHG